MEKEKARPARISPFFEELLAVLVIDSRRDAGLSPVTVLPQASAVALSFLLLLAGYRSLFGQAHADDRTLVLRRSG